MVQGVALSWASNPVRVQGVALASIPVRIWASNPVRVQGVALSWASNPARVQVAALTVMGQYSSSWSLGKKGCQGPVPLCESREVHCQGPVPLWCSFGLNWLSRASTPAGVPWAALVVKSQFYSSMNLFLIVFSAWHTFTSKLNLTETFHFCISEGIKYITEASALISKPHLPSLCSHKL